MPFRGRLTVTLLDLPSPMWRVEVPLGFDGAGWSLEVAPAFVSDLASTPRLLWWLIPQWGTYARAAVCHDLLCQLLKAGTPHAAAPAWRTAARRFHEMLIACGTGQVLRSILFLGVWFWALRRDLAGTI